MKKSIIILSILIVASSLTAFVVLKQDKSDPAPKVTSHKASFDFDKYFSSECKPKKDIDLFYSIRNRWSTMTKDELQQVKSIKDIIKDDERYKRDSFWNVRIDILHNYKDVRDVEISEIGQQEQLTAAQLRLLNSIDYSTNIRFSALNKRTNLHSGVVISDSTLHYVTIIPENEAEFKGGKQALLEYLKESSKDEVAIITEDKLEPGKIYFTVTAHGTIDNVHLGWTCGFPSVDEALMQIVSEIPKKWEVASNSNGEKVDQEFVFFFGLEGC